MITREQWLTALSKLARNLGAEINRGAWTVEDVRDLIDELLLSNPMTAGMDVLERHALAARLDDEAQLTAIRAPLAAVQAIRDALGPMMAARKHRGLLTIAAYRIANGRLEASQVERIVDEETKAFMARLNAGITRHAG